LGVRQRNEVENMKHVLSTIPVAIFLTAASSAAEVATTPDTNKATEDCSKQVWPHFSPSCLRNADQAINQQNTPSLIETTAARMNMSRVWRPPYNGPS
jgi:hypothetical protein